MSQDAWTLARAQSSLRELVIRASNVAAENGVTCIAAYGTALGIYRDQDLIAWDTDADLIISWDELDPLVTALRKHPMHDREFRVHDTTTNGYDHLFPRLSVPGVDQNSLHVDLFPLVGTSPNAWVSKCHLKLGKSVSLVYMLKTCDAPRRYGHDSRRRLLCFIAKIAFLPVPLRLLRLIFRVLATAWQLQPGGMSLNLGGSYGEREVLPTDAYFPPEVSQLSGQPVHIPAQPETYLRHMYGDFETPPSRAEQERALDFFHRVTLPKMVS